jgi:UPF0716 family protein affecting phage T7 exclusion
MRFMKRLRVLLIVLTIIGFTAVRQASAQCSICTKTSMQQGEKPARGMNSGIVYLMLAPFAIIGFIGYWWWKNERA